MMKTGVMITVLLCLVGQAAAEEGIMLPPTARLWAGPTLEPQQAPFGASKKLVAWAVAGQVLDLLTTHIVVDQRGGFEVNPLMKNRYVRYSTKGLLILAAVGMASGQQAKIPILKRVPAWKAEGWLKTIGWVGMVPAAGNAVQLPTAGEK